VSEESFYGWWVTAASFVVLFVTVGVGLYAPPVFLVPLQDHFGWSRAAIAGGSATAALVSGIASPFAGVLIDKYGSRRVMVSGALLMACGFGFLGLVQSLWHLYALNALAAIGIACAAWVPNQTLISNWFEKKRGLAMGVALTGIGFGGLAMAPLAGLLIVRFGWRLAFVGLSSLLLVIVVTVVLGIVRDRPADLGLLPDGEPPTPSDRSPTSTDRAASFGERPGLELSQSVRTSAFWILFLCQFLTVFGSMSVIAHLVAFLRDAGFEGQTAAGSLGLMVGASVGGRVLFGVLSDRLTKRHIMSLALTLHAVATTFLFRIESAAALPAFVLTFGVALGGGAVLMPLLVGECFGLLAFGRILGLFTVSATLGAGLGPVLTGRIYDVSGSYQPAFVLHIVAFATAALAIQLLAKPRNV
jgi:MFS family permease